MESFGSNHSKEIKDFSELIPLFLSILKENKVIKEENFSLKNLKKVQEKSNYSNLQLFEQLLKISPIIENQINYLNPSQDTETIPSKLLRRTIQDTINNPFFWKLRLMGLSKNEILEILNIGSSSSKLKGIDSGSNYYFDEECGKAYEKFILENNSMLGIDLYKLNFSMQHKLNIIYLVKQKKPNVKLAIIQTEGATEKEINSIAQSLGWQLNSRAYICSN